MFKKDCSCVGIEIDEDDDWFYESIQRYKSLQMYDLQMTPYCLASFKDNWLCLAGHRDNKTEIICSEIPKKLLLPEKESGRCKGNDFEIRSGNMYNGLIREFHVIPGEDAAVAGFIGQNGLVKLEVDTENLGPGCEEVSKGKEDVIFEMFEPNFAIHPSAPQLIACKTPTAPLISVDILSQQQHTITLSTSLGTTGEIIPSYQNENTAALLNSCNGLLSTVDLRSNVEVEVHGDVTQEKWSFANDGNNQIVLISEKGILKLFDLKQIGQLVAEKQLPGFFKNRERVVCSKKRMNARKKIVFSEGKVSVSGFNNVVNIYDVSGGDVRKVFTHEGHSYVEDLCEGYVTDHVWLPHIASNLLVSCSDNGSLICWQYDQQIT